MEPGVEKLAQASVIQCHFRFPFITREEPHMQKILRRNEGNMKGKIILLDVSE